MNKKFFIVLFFLLISFSVYGQYVRKLKEPNFFIPIKDKMHKVEKLPNIKKRSSIITHNTYEKPVYKLKYDEYLKDVSIFSKTKKMPENYLLNQDLKSMEEGDIFEVNDTYNKVSITKEFIDFEKTVDNILKN